MTALRIECFSVYMTYLHGKPVTLERLNALKKAVDDEILRISAKISEDDD